MSLLGRFRPVDRLIVTHGLSSFCLGLVFPYTAIHLAALPGVGTGGVALFYGAAGVANLAVALLLTGGVLRLPRVTLGVLGTLLWFVGYLTMPFVSSHALALVAGVAIGCGQGGFLAAIVPLVNSLVTAEERRKVFARRYAVLNATLAAGSLVAGALTLVLPRGVIPYFFVANAVGILPLTLAMLIAGRHARAADEEKEKAGEGRTGRCCRWRRWSGWPCRPPPSSSPSSSSASASSRRPRRWSPNGSCRWACSWSPSCSPSTSW